MKERKKESSLFMYMVNILSSLFPPEDVRVAVLFSHVCLLNEFISVFDGNLESELRLEAAFCGGCVGLRFMQYYLVKITVLKARAPAKPKLC